MFPGSFPNRSESIRRGNVAASRSHCALMLTARIILPSSFTSLDHLVSADAPAGSFVQLGCRLMSASTGDLVQTRPTTVARTLASSDFRCDAEIEFRCNPIAKGPCS